MERGEAKVNELPALILYISGNKAESKKSEGRLTAHGCGTSRQRSSVGGSSFESNYTPRPAVIRSISTFQTENYRSTLCSSNRSTRIPSESNEAKPHNGLRFEHLYGRRINNDHNSVEGTSKRKSTLPLMRVSFKQETSDVFVTFC